MIKSFRHKGLEAFWLTDSTEGIQAPHAKKLGHILDSLDAATVPAELSLPGYRLHQLKGKRSGYWSIRVRGNWRVTFRMKDGEVEHVDYEDYH